MPGKFKLTVCMEAFLVSMVVVALGEIGDKTQLLALMLAARLRQPVPIVLGIVVATLANHTLAGLVGGWIREIVPTTYLRWLLALSFLLLSYKRWSNAACSRSSTQDGLSSSTSCPKPPAAKSSATFSVGEKML